MDESGQVTAILARLKGGQLEHRTRINRYDNAYNIYRASMPRAKTRRAWEADIRVPYARQVIDTELVNIVSGQPKVKVMARHPDGELAAKAMQFILDYEVREDHFVEKQPLFAQQALIFGTTIAKNHWLYSKKTRKDRVYDQFSGQFVPVDKEIVVRDGPTFEPWSVYRCYWSPGARSADEAEYVVLQTYLSKDELLEHRFDPDNGTGLYNNLDQLFAAGSGKQPLGTSQENYLGLDNRAKDKFLIEEIWTNDHLFVIGNGNVLLRSTENPYWHGRKPIVIAQVMPDLFELQGIADTEAVNDLQQALWTAHNLRTDNMKFTVHRGITYREGGVTDPDALELRPRFKWPVSDHDDIRPFEVQPLPPEAYEEESTLLSRMQLVTGVNSYISGADTTGVDQNTATGVTALQNVASRLLRFKADQLQNKGYLRSFEQWGDMIQQFMSSSTAVEIAGQGNDSQWVHIDPHQIAGHFRYTLESSEESLSQQQDRSSAVALLNAFAPLAGAVPNVNWEVLLERVASAYDFPNPESLFKAPQAPPAAYPQQGSPQQQQPGGLDPRVMAALGQQQQQGQPFGGQ